MIAILQSHISVMHLMAHYCVSKENKCSYYNALQGLYDQLGELFKGTMDYTGLKCKIAELCLFDTLTS